jgi:hypothetical protein
MREPQSLEERWRWWESAVAGEDPPVYEDEPQSGFYAVRKFSYGAWAQGPFIPARVWWESEIDPETGELMSPEECRAEIDGVFVNPWRSWTWLARRPIPESEWRWLKAQSPLLPTKIPKRPSR